MSEVKNIPDGWVEITLGEISLKKQYGYTESASAEKIGPKFLRITDIQNDFINWNTVPYCSISDSDYKKYKVAIGDIVIARTGNSTGATTVIKENIDAVFASFLIRFQLNNEIADYNFIDFLLRSTYWKGFVNSVKSGSAQGGANANDFATFKFWLPTLPEQKSIAEILTAFDDKIQLLQAQNKTLEETAKTIFTEWFGKYSVDDKLPEEWRVEIVSNLFEVRDGTHDSPKQSEIGMPLITSRHILNNNLDFKNAYLISKKDFAEINKRSLVEQNDILFSMIGTLGLTFLEQSEKVNYAIKNIALFKTSKNSRWIYYTYLWLRSNLGKDFIKNYKSGSTQEYIPLGSLRNILFVVPNAEFLEDFNNVVKPIFEKIKVNTEQIQALTKTRDELLPRLMSGEVRVNEFKA